MAERFADAWSEMFWHLRTLFQTGNIAIPPDDELIRQLTGFRFSREGEVIRVESREEYTKRTGENPSKAVAVALAMWGQRGTDEKANPETGLMKYNTSVVRTVLNRMYRVIFKPGNSYAQFQSDIKAAEEALGTELGPEIVTGTLLNAVVQAVTAARQRLDRERPRGSVPWEEFERVFWEELKRKGPTV